jgi:hypothetical protein
MADEKKEVEPPSGDSAKDPLQALKQARTTSLRLVTQARKKLREALDKQDAESMHPARDQLLDAFEEYREACIKLEGTEADDESRFRDTEDLVGGLLSRMDTFERSMQSLRPTVTGPVKMASIANSSASRTSKASSTQSQKMAARIAGLMVQRERMGSLQELQRQQRSVEDELQRYQLQTEIDSAMASKRALTEAEQQTADELLSGDPVDLYPTYANDHMHEPSSVHVVDNVDAYEYDHTYASHVDASASMNGNTQTGLAAPILTPSTSVMDPSAPPFVSRKPKAVDRAITFASPVAASSIAPVNLDPVLTALSLPKHELLCFDGDVTKYHAFIAGFDLRAGGKQISDAEKLHILYTYLKGEPREVIGGCFNAHPTVGYNDARALLEKTYGNPYRLAMAYRNQLAAWGTIKNNDAVQLRMLECFLTQCIGAMKGGNSRAC